MKRNLLSHLDPIKRTLSPPLFKNDARKTRQARLLHLFVLGLLLITVTVVCLDTFFIDKRLSMRTTVMSLLFVALLTVYHLLKKERATETTDNISEQVKSQHALPESEQRFRRVIEQSQDGVAVNDEKGILITWNAAMERITGLSAADVIDHPIWEVQFRMLSPDDQTEARREALQTNLQSFLETGTAPWANQLLDREYTRPDGETLHVQGITFPIQTDKGFMLGSITRDITLQKRAEKALRISEKNYRTLFEEASDAILVLDVQSNIVDANKRTSELLGVSHDELLQRNAVEFLHEEDVKSKDHVAALALLMEGNTVHSDYRLRRIDGSYLPTELSTKMLDETRFLNIARDLTERVAAEKALRESEERYRLLVDKSPYAIWIHQDGEIVFFNPAAEGLLGAKAADELVGLPMEQIVVPEYWEAAQIRIEGLLQGETALYPVEEQFVRFDGTVVPVEVTAVPFTHKNKPAIQVIALDITQRKLTNEALAHALVGEKDARQLAETMQAANISLSRTLELDTVLETLLDYLGQLVPYDSANVMLRETESQLRVHAFRGYEQWTNVELIRNNIYDVQKNAHLARIFQTKQGVLISDTRQSESWENRHGSEHVLSWMGVPLIAGGEVIGLYSVDKLDADFFTEDHLRLVMALAAQAAVALKNARLFDAEKAQRDLAEALRDTAVSINSARTEADVWDAVIGQSKVVYVPEKKERE